MELKQKKEEIKKIKKEKLNKLREKHQNKLLEIIRQEKPNCFLNKIDGFEKIEIFLESIKKQMKVSNQIDWMCGHIFRLEAGRPARMLLDQDGYGWLPEYSSITKEEIRDWNKKINSFMNFFRKIDSIKKIRISFDDNSRLFLKKKTPIDSEIFDLIGIKRIDITQSYHVANLLHDNFEK